VAAPGVAPQRRIVLQPVAGAVLVHRQRRQVGLGVVRPHRRRDVDARRQQLPRLVRIQPPFDANNRMKIGL